MHFLKTRIENLVFLPALIVGISFLAAGQVTAQTFRTLYNFTDIDNGLRPEAGLVLSGDTLYGTTYQDFTLGWGEVFKVKTNGTGFTVLHTFTNGIDGAWPEAALIVASNTLYGTTGFGGSAGKGTVFAMNTDGTGFRNVYSFSAGSAGSPYTNSDGGYPEAALLLSSNTLYGTADQGGAFGYGTVFAVNTDGTGFTNLHNFTNGRDGARPMGALILLGQTLYGTASQGGTPTFGTVFALNTDGTGFTILHTFAAYDGAFPEELTLLDNTLYGVVPVGGSSSWGTLFKVNTDGTGFTNLYSFTAMSGPLQTNIDGASPSTGLSLSGNTLYGTASRGGTSGNGTVFAVNTDGTGFTNLHNFTQTSPAPNSRPTNGDGATPNDLILSGKTLFGTAFGGGTLGSGTVFSLSLDSVTSPQLTIFRSASDVILTWPTNAAGFTLQSTTNLGSAALWSPVSRSPIVVDGKHSITNPGVGAQNFYRLIQ